MTRRLFLVAMNEIEAERMRGEIAAAGWEVEVEAEDHGRAYEFVKRERPDILVILLDHQPPAARKVARSIQMEEGFEQLPILFVGGDAAERELARAEIEGAQYVAKADLMTALAQLSR